MGDAVIGKAWLVPLSVLLTAGCAAQFACTAAGCDSGVTFTASNVGQVAGEALVMRACVDEVCSDSIGVDQDVIVVQLPDTGSRAAVASITITRAGTVLVQGSTPVQLTKTAPNGEKCGPICFGATVEVTKDGLEAMPIGQS